MLAVCRPIAALGIGAVCCGLLAWGPIPVWADSPQGGIEFVVVAKADGGDASAYQKAKEAAKNGDAQALYSLGVMTLSGTGVKADAREAVRLFRLSADKGNRSSCFQLGVCYNFGYGVSRDENQAVQWFGKAATLGHAKALEQIKTMATSGNKQAEAWLSAQKQPSPVATPKTDESTTSARTEQRPQHPRAEAEPSRPRRQMHRGPYGDPGDAPPEPPRPRPRGPEMRRGETGTRISIMKMRKCRGVMWHPCGGMPIMVTLKLCIAWE